MHCALLFSCCYNKFSIFFTSQKKPFMDKLHCLKHFAYVGRPYSELLNKHLIRVCWKKERWHKFMLPQETSVAFALIPLPLECSNAKGGRSSCQADTQPSWVIQERNVLCSSPSPLYMTWRNVFLCKHLAFQLML